MASGKGPLRIAIEDFIKTYKLPIEIQRSFLSWADRVETQTLNFMGTQFNRYEIDDRLVGQLMNMLSKRGEGEALPILIGLVFVLVGFLTNGANALLTPVYRGLEIGANELVPNQRMDESGIIRAYWRGRYNAQDFTRRMAQRGFDPSEATHLLEANRPLLTENEAMAALWRGKFNLDSFGQYLERRGWKKDEIDVWKELSVSLPGIQDTIRFLVRDVTQDSVVQRYGYDENWPNAEIIELGRKLGYPERVMQYYWRAHWTLPSVTQVFEMLHRGVLGENGIGIVDEFLRINDYPKFWRDKLIAISYQPLRLVDTRNAFKLGVINYDTMRRKFKDRGLNDEDATIAANLVVAQQKDKDKDLSIAQIITIYESGGSTRVQAIEDLRGIGYDEIEAQKLLIPADRRLIQRQIEEQIELIHQRYTDGRIIEQEAASLLTNLGVSAPRTEALLIKWGKELKPRPKLPTQADLEKWAKVGYITPQQYREDLILIGHRQPFVDLYLRELLDALSEPKK